MAVTHYDLSAKFTDLLGTAYSPTSTKVVAWIETNVGASEGIVDEVANSIALGGSRQVADGGGNVTWANLVGSDSTPADINLESGTLQYRVTAEYVDAITRRRKTWTSGWFSLTADIDLADVVAETYVPVAWMTTATATLQTYVDAGQAAATTASAAATTASGAADTAVNAAGLASEIAMGDGGAALAAADLDPGSAFRIQNDPRLAAAYVAKPAIEADDLSLLMRDRTVANGFSWTTPEAAIARALGWFVVTDYGATGDGTTDDQPAIYSTVVAAWTAGGGVVYFPKGTYIIGASLNLTPANTSRPLILRGVGAASIIKTKNGTDAKVTNSSATLGVPVVDLTLQDLVFDGNKANAINTQSIVTFDGAVRLTAINCTFQNAQGYGFGLQAFPGRTDGRTGDQKDIALIRCLFLDNGMDGVDIKYCVGITLTDCIARGNTIDGFDVRGLDVVFKGCRSESNGGTGWEFLTVANNLYGSAISQPISHTLVGCVARNNTSYGYSVVVTTNETQPYTFRMTGCTASGNSRGLQVRTQSNGLLELEVDGLTAKDNTEFGVSIETSVCKSASLANVLARSNGSHGVRVDDVNVVMSNVVAVDNVGSGIALTNTATGCTLTGGRLAGNLAPVGATGGGGSGGVDALRVSNVSGYKTRSDGTATVAAASTSVAVTHGLDRTPTAANLSVTPTSTLGTAAKFWVSAVGATTFTINTDVAPGGSGASFAWTADVNPS